MRTQFRINWVLNSIACASLTACGSSEAPQAEKRQVEGRSAGQLSLVTAPDERCAALVEYTQLFSSQHTQNAYRDITCRSEGSLQKLVFVISNRDQVGKNDPEQPLATVVVRAGETQMASALICTFAADDRGQESNEPMDQDGESAIETAMFSTCLGVGSLSTNPQVATPYRSSSIRLDDFLYSLSLELGTPPG